MSSVLASPETRSHTREGVPAPLAAIDEAAEGVRETRDRGGALVRVSTPGAVIGWRTFA